MNILWTPAGFFRGTQRTKQVKIPEGALSASAIKEVDDHSEWEEVMDFSVHLKSN